MSNLFDIENQIKAVGTEPAVKMYLACPCGHTFEHAGMPPKECPSCLVEVQFTTGKTPAEAKSKLIKSKNSEIRKDSKVIEENTKTDEEGSKEKRARAVAEMIKRKKINEITPVHVGLGVIDAPGFTAWKDGKPDTAFYEDAFDTPDSFRAAFSAAREKSSNVQLDVFRVAELSKELHEVSYRGVITVNRNSGHKLIKAKAGDIIEIGALKTAKNALIFVALGVKK